MSDEENYGDRVLRIAREQNVSQASAARGARIEIRLEQKLKRRNEQNSQAKES
jgi:hypothetical protein